MKRVKWLIALVGLLMWSDSPAFAAPILWSTNIGGSGHWYERIVATCTWLEAKGYAEQKSYAGLPGHLATLTSANENAWVASNLHNSYDYLGGYQDFNDPNYSEPAGGWKWITGEVWSYTNWSPYEPNNCIDVTTGDYESVLTIWSGAKWNDFHYNRSGYTSGYIIEYETSPVPEPSSVLLALGGLSALLGLRRRHS